MRCVGEPFGREIGSGQTLAFAEKRLVRRMRVVVVAVMVGASGRAMRSKRTWPEACFVPAPVPSLAGRLRNVNCGNLWIITSMIAAAC